MRTGLGDECDWARDAHDFRQAERIDFAVYCVAPDSGTEAAYRLAYLDGLESFLGALKQQGERPRRIFFASSTSVYSQRRGEWIDEASTASPSRYAGEILVQAERLLLASGFVMLAYGAEWLVAAAAHRSRVKWWRRSGAGSARDRHGARRSDRGECFATV